MTLCLLVRHAAHDLLGRVLVGRRDGVPLNEAGRDQAMVLAERLSPLRITRIQSSPRDRAVQTAAPIADHTGLPVEICSALDEVEFGSWTGRRFRDLEREATWRNWNDRRELSHAPGGEGMADVQARIVAHLRQMCARRSHARVVMISHAEVIRAAVLYCMSQPLGAWATVEVPCASVMAVQVLSRRRCLVDLQEPAAA